MDKTSKNSTKVCAVASCPNPNGISYHIFPKWKDLQRLWLRACRRKDFVNLKTAAICSRHFKPEDFERDLRNELLNLPLRSLLKPGLSQYGLGHSL